MTEKIETNSTLELFHQRILIFSVLVIASCGICYELLISTLSSYLLGSSVTHFSLTIGIFMFFMGIGAYLSKICQQQLIERLIWSQILLGITGGVSSICLHALYSFSEYYYLGAFIFISIISVLVGIEIPLITRIIEPYQGLSNSIAKVFAFDYLGALIASVLFPFVLLPYLGTLHTAILVGMLNLVVAAVLAFEFRKIIFLSKAIILPIILGFSILMGLFWFGSPIASILERAIYEDEIIFSEQTPYQRIVLTKFKNDLKLFINGNLQFSSIDEARYHEPLVYVPLLMAKSKRNVLLLGGGDGLALREILKLKAVKEVTVVDLDPQMISLAKSHPDLLRLNESSFSDKRVSVVNQDAYNFVKEGALKYDVIISDLPDPSDVGLSKLYSKEFFGLISKRLRNKGVFITQASSPYYARQAFWSIEKTMKSIFTQVIPITVLVPSFGQWGFQIGSTEKIDPRLIKISSNYNYLDQSTFESLFHFPKDMMRVETEINTLVNPVLVSYYENSWEEWNG